MEKSTWSKSNKGPVKALWTANIHWVSPLGFPHLFSGASPPPHFAVPACGAPLGCPVMCLCLWGGVELRSRCVLCLLLCIVYVLLCIVYVVMLFVVGSFQSVSWKFDFWSVLGVFLWIVSCVRDLPMEPTKTFSMNCLLPMSSKYKIFNYCT